MAFISTSVTDATKIGATASEIASTQSGSPSFVASISKAASTAISGTTIGTTATKASGTVSSVNTALGSVNSFLQSSLKSINSVFDTGVKSLASGLDSTLTNLFKDTNVKSSSTTTTLISDPIKTNLINAKIPASSSFKIDPFEAGSQSVGMSGFSSQFGSNASSMIGTNLSTVMNRLNLDSVSSVANGVATNKSSTSLKSLFSTVSSVTKTISGVAATVQAIKQVPNQVAAQLTRSISNSVQSFTGRSDLLANLTGKDASSYYLGTNTLSLLDQDKNVVTSTSTSTDANTANAILAVAREIGCDTNGVTEYSSTNELSSLYNLILSLASEQGLTDLVNSLLGCSMASSTYGQSAIITALKSVSSTDIATTNQLLAHVTDPTILQKNQDLARSILSNSNLSSADAAAVSAALAALNYTPTEAFEIETLSDGSIKIYDSNALSSSEKSILDSLFDDTSFSTFLTGQTVDLLPNGTFWV